MKEDMNFSNEMSVRKNVLEMILYGTVILFALSAIATELFFHSRPDAIAFGLQSILSVGMIVASRMGVPYRIISYVEVSVLNFVIIPMLFFYDGGVNGPNAVWYVAAVILVFILVDNVMAGFTCVFATILLFGVMIKMNRGHMIDLPESKTLLLVDYLMTFFYVAGIVIILIIYQRKLYEDMKTRKLKNRAALMEASNAKGRFLANVSHEIRMPMNSIIGLSEMIIRENPDAYTRDEAKTISQESYGLLSILDDVLAVSKLDSGKLRLMHVQYSFRDMMKNLLESVANEMYNHKVTCDIRIDKQIPAMLYGDDLYIRQIYTYILATAIENIQNGLLFVKIDCEKTEEDEVVIRTKIANTGVGLSKYDVDSLFGTYNIYDSKQSSNLKGMGLKYSICRSLLKLMDGEISVESIEGVAMSTEFTFKNKIVDPKPMVEFVGEEDQNVLIYVNDVYIQNFWIDMLTGTSVRMKFFQNHLHLAKLLFDKKYQSIFIPASIFDKVEKVLRDYECLDSTYIVGEYYNTLDDFNGCRMIKKPISCINVMDVLNGEWDESQYVHKMNHRDFIAPKASVMIIDENAMSIKLIAEMFQKYQVNVDIATSGEDTMTKIQTFDYDMIFVNYSLQDMNGLNLMEKIRSLPGDEFRDIPIILMTSGKDIDTRDEFIQIGFTDHIVKPIKPNDIERCLLEHLRENKIETVKTETEHTAKETEKPGTPKIQPGLDTSKGLMNTGFNQEAYEAILNTYYKECLKNVALLEELSKQEDLSLFTTYVHGMKSSSASIGAMEVSDLFKQLEFAGKEGRREFIHEHLYPYSEKMSEMLNIVKEYLTERGTFESEEAVSEQKCDLAEETISQEFLQELKKNISIMNLSECDRLFRDIANHNYGSDMNGRLRDMKKAYENFDFHTVKQILGDVME